jgi:hypothetical protein
MFFAFCAALALTSSLSAHAQAKALITTKVDETRLVQLKGNVPAQVKGAQDLGLADASQPTGRLMLVLKRSDEQESALQSFLLTAHQKGSANFHKWLAPGEFGKKFGASDSDVQQLTTWLQSHGLKVAGVSGSRNTIEFSGNIGQVNEAFHTTIHKYSVKDAKSGALETHYSNASDPQVPAAFSAAVAGVTHLDDFKPKSQVKMMGEAKYDAKKHTGVPQWTVPDGFGPGTPVYFLAPEDFATQYDVNPVYAAGINGAGQTIGIINDSNVDLSLVNAYRKLFNLPLNPPQIVIDGNDPGINGDSIEAYLDLENSGSIAPAATVKLYIAGGFGLLGDGGLDFALLRAVNDDAASVLSLSFGGCETYSGTASNEFISSLWEEAAAQGQTVMVSTGDSGSYDGCNGLGVNSLASSPWDIAVGGTDAYFTDYATGGASISTFWSDTNDASLGSLQTKFAEQPWNGTQYGLNSITYDPVIYQPGDTGAGGGGASSCVVSSQDPNTGAVICISGWPKPSWQVGTGVPADGVRDLPDVSLFASNGYNGVLWPICAEAGDCTSSDPISGDLYVTGVGGTSASAPAMAGIMALINQKYGPQGQANYVLYPMAAQFPAAFNDITVGSNNEPCSSSNVGYELGCAADPVGGGYSLQNYSAGVGYDEASGLGTIDVNQLYTNWSKIAFKTSGTTLSLSPTTFTHGTSVTASVAVTGTGTPAGAVSLVADTTLANSKSVTYIELADGTGSTVVTNLPGGTYTVTGNYSGDGINAASVSSPVTVTVSPEASTLLFAPEYVDPNTYNVTPVTAGATVPFNSALLLDVQIAGATGTVDGTATGTVTFKDGGTVLSTASVSAAGTAEFNGAGLAIGTHTVSASYSGDASYNASSSAPVQFTVGQASVFGVIFADLSATYNNDGSVGYVAGQSANFTGLVASNIANGGPCPSGTVTFQLGTLAPVTSTLAPCENLQLVLGSTATALFANLKAGTYTLTMTYAGDANYTGTVATQVVEVTAATLLPSTTTIVTSPLDLSSATPSTPISVAITVSGNGTTTLTGMVTLSLANFLTFNPVTLTPNGDGTASATLSFRAADLLQGPNQLIATYSGDTNYSSSVSTTSLVLDDPSDFSMQTPDTTMTVATGSTASVGLTFTSLSGFNGSVQIGCFIPAGLFCTPAVTAVTVNGTASTTVLINTVTTVPAPMSSNAGGAGWMRTGAGTMLACLLFFVLPGRRRLGRAALSALVMMVMLSGVGCGGGKAAGPTTVSTNAKPGTYTALIYGTGSNGIQHDVPVTIIVK